jgi:carboxymethylenebutenolidase
VSIREEVVDVATPDGPMALVTYRHDDGASRPAIILAHDALGLDENIRDITRRYAEAGYTAAAPDFYHRAGRLLHHVHGAPRNLTMPMREGMTNRTLVSDAQAALDHLNALPGATGRVGITGFCLGGRVSFLAATSVRGLTASAPMYATRLREEDPQEAGGRPPIEKAGDITCALRMYFPALDYHTPLPEATAIMQMLQEAKAPWEAEVYADADHGFFQEASPAYHATRSKQAWASALAFFNTHLKAS